MTLCSDSIFLPRWSGHTLLIGSQLFTFLGFAIFCGFLTFLDMADDPDNSVDRPSDDGDASKPEKMFTLKKWNAVAMWSWDVECDICAICRVQVMDSCLRCQADNKRDVMGRQDCVVVWGECNHSFHHCCMSLWVKQNNRCPLCQQEWSIQRMGK